MATIMVHYWRTGCPSWAKFMWSHACRLTMGKTKNFVGKWTGESVKLGILVCTSSARSILVCVRGWHQIDWKETKFRSHVEEIDEKTVICWSLRRFLITCTWDALIANVNQTKKSLTKTEKLFESRISAGATEKLPQLDKNGANVIAWSYNMEEHAKKCVEEQSSNGKGLHTMSLLSNRPEMSVVGTHW